MKIQRSFACLCLVFSSCALIAVTARVSAGDQPGVVRMASESRTFEPPVPVPPADGDSASQNAPMQTPKPDHGVPPEANGNQNGSSGMPIPMGQSFPMDQGIPFEQGVMPFEQPADYTPYFQQSGGATEAAVIGRRPADNPVFGPQLMFESNIGDGLGFGKSYHRLNARLPYHVVPGNSVLFADLSASVSDDNQNLYNLGAVWRNYDASRNRIFGWNAFWDIDDGYGNEQWKRLGIGMESLGKYLDFRVNGYFVRGTDSVMLDSSLTGALTQVGNNVTRIRHRSYDNAYSGGEFEVGGPLPYLGRRGLNLYAGGYYLDNDYGYEATGFSARLQALLTESATVNVSLTTDDTFGTNSWVSVSYSIPNYGESSIMQRKSVRERLTDPVYRSNRIHSNLDVKETPEAILNAKTGAAWHIVYVDPDAVDPGLGTFESPYSSLHLANIHNSSDVDVIQVGVREDGTGTNLTAAGGFDLFDCQSLISDTQDFVLYTEGGTDFILSRSSEYASDMPELRPLISNPTIDAGGYVVGVRNENTIRGMQIDASNEAKTNFGTGITNIGGTPFEDISVVGNSFGNYTTGY